MAPTRPKRPADVVLAVVAVGAAVGALALMALRLRYGVDFRDEAYYAALAYRFALGDRPFVDEMSLFQLPAMLTFPLIKAWVAVTGGTNGVILFMRAAWLVFAAGIAAAAFLFLRTLVRWEVALIASLVAVVAVPFDIPSLSYDSMGAGLLALGMLVGAWTVVHGRSRRWLAAAGVLHGFAVFAYPTLVLAVLAYAAALVVLYRRRSPGPLGAYVGGGAVVAALLAAIVLGGGVGNVARDWAYVSRLGGYAGGGAKIARIAWQSFWFFAHQPLFVAALAAGVGLSLLLPHRGRWAILLPVVAVFPVRYVPTHILATYAVTLLGIVALAVGPFAKRGGPLARRLYLWGVAPAAVAACVTAYTSSNGLVSAAIGFFPALFALPGLLALVLPADGAKGTVGEAALPWALAGVLLVTVAHLAVYEYRGVYHDSPVRYLSAEVDGGPFAGLRTLPETARFDAQLRADVARYVRPGENVLFFDNLPAGYLYAGARPAANALWLSLSDDAFGPARHPTLEWWRRTGRYPDVAFRYLYRTTYPPRHVVRAFVSPPRYRLEAVRPRYEVWVRAGAGD